MQRVSLLHDPSAGRLKFCVRNYLFLKLSWNVWLNFSIHFIKSVYQLYSLGYCNSITCQNIILKTYTQYNIRHILEEISHNDNSTFVLLNFSFAVIYVHALNPNLHERILIQLNILIRFMKQPPAEGRWTFQPLSPSLH